MKVEDLDFTLKIKLDRFVNFTPDLGAVTIKHEGREFILDVSQSYKFDDHDCECGSTIQCQLEGDKDTFEDCAFDLTVEDLLNKHVFAEFYIHSDEEEFEVESMRLYFTIDGKNKSINVVEE